MNETPIQQDSTMDVRKLVAQRQAQQQAESTEAPQTPQHGDYVEGKNGEVGGILIDHDVVMKQQTEQPHIKDIEKYLEGMDARINDAAAEAQKILDAKQTEQSIVANSNPMNPETADIKKVSELFAQFEPSATGLAPVGSVEADTYKQKMDALNSGTVDINNYQNIDDAPSVEQKPVVDETPVPSEVQSDAPTDKVVQFNVDSKNVEAFMTSLSPDERSRVVKTDTIIINEIKNLTVPTATRTITSMAEFKRVMPKQAHSLTVETVNVNSGFVATFKGCGALALATIIPDDETEGVDYAKRLELCYDNLVTTSLGKMSFQEFCSRTHINDLPNMMFAILRASDPDENMVRLQCADCETTYDVKYRLSELLDMDSIDDETSERIDEIIANRSTYEDAMKVHMESSIMKSKYVQFVINENLKYTFEIKAPNSATFVSMYSRLRAMMDKHSRYVAGMLAYIPKIFIETIPAGETTPAVYEVTDVDAIAEIIKDLDKTCIQAIGKILEGITEYQTPTYSFKGKFRCPKCGRTDTKVPCTVDSLVFTRVDQAIR